MMSIRPIDLNCTPIEIRNAVGEILSDIMPLILRSLCFEAILPLTTLSHSLRSRIIYIIRTEEQAHIDTTFTYLKVKLPSVPTVEEIPHDLSQATSLPAIRKCLVTSIKAAVTFLKGFEPELLNPLQNCHEDVNAPSIATEIAALLDLNKKFGTPIDPEPWCKLIDNSRSDIAVHSKAIKLLDKSVKTNFTIKWLCNALAGRDDFRNALKANKDNDPKLNAQICEIALQKGYTIITRDVVKAIALRSLTSIIANENPDAAVKALTHLTHLISKVTKDLPDDLMADVLDGIITTLNEKNHFKLAVDFVALLTNEEDKLNYLKLIIKTAKEREAFHNVIYVASFPLSEYPSWSFSSLTEIARRAADDASFSLVNHAIGAITVDEEDTVAVWKLNDLFLHIAKAAFNNNELEITFKFLSMISPGRRFSIELAITEMEQKSLKFYLRSKQFLEVVRYEFGISTSLPERELLLKAIADDYKSRIDIFNSGKNEDED